MTKGKYIFLVLVLGLAIFSNLLPGDFFVFHEDFKQWSSSSEVFQKHYYAWSAAGSAVNIDGIMRFFTRLPVYIFSTISDNNIGISYFYILFSLVFTFISFCTFSRMFLGVRQVHITVIFSLIYTLSPIFLGNLSKIGLMYAVSFLPLMLVCVKRIFDECKFNDIYLISLLFLFSLIHPFTTLINIVVVAVYAFYKFSENPRQSREIFGKVVWKVLVSGLLLLYITLPIISIGSVSKEVISSTIGNDPGNLLLGGIAKTNGLSEALTLSKSVFLDYTFYSGATEIIYILASYGVIVIAIFFILIYFTGRKKAGGGVFITSLIIFLFLTLVSTGDSYRLSQAVYDFLISSPFAWFFRSPLKWQLYIPFFLTVVLLVGFINYKNFDKKIISSQKILWALSICFIVSITHISGSVLSNLLVPKNVALYESGIQIKSSDKALLIFNDSCVTLSKDNPKMLDEMIFFFHSKGINLTRLNDTELLKQNWVYDQFKFVVACEKNPIKNDEDFSLVASMGEIYIFKNQKSINHISSLENLFLLDDASLKNENYDFILKKLNMQFNVAQYSDEVRIPGIKFKRLFENEQAEDILSGALIDEYSSQGVSSLIIEMNKDENENVNSESFQRLSINDLSGSEYPFEKNNNFFESQLDAASEMYSFELSVGDEHIENVVPNPSLENGLWKNEVGDCFNYDDNPQIGMSHSRNSSEGVHSLELMSKRHLACTGPPPLKVASGAEYLLSFDYQTDSASKVGYNITFDDQEKTTQKKKINVDNDQWHGYDEKFVVPVSTKNAKLTLYSYPTNGREEIATRYDNFSLVKLPELNSSYYVMSESFVETATPESINFAIINPTKKGVMVRGATKPFYLTMSESYHEKWQLYLDNGKVRGFLDRWWPFVSPDRIADDKHFKYMTFLNGWYIDPREMCDANWIPSLLYPRVQAEDDTEERSQKVHGGCTLNSDGSYDMEMIIEFTPQRWFYLGLLISGATFIFMVIYLIGSTVRQRRRGY